MKMSIVIPVFNQLLATFGQWGTLLANAGDWRDVELIVVDNGSTDNTEALLKRFIMHRVPNKQYLKLPENVGYSKGVNVGLNVASGDVVCVMHNDLFVYEHDWLHVVCELFEKQPNIGVMGFIGATKATADGGRDGVISNLSDAEQHGSRFAGNRPVILFDSVCLIARKLFWRDAGGLDEEYGPNHWTDKDISMKSVTNGLTNLCVAANCYHPGSTTAHSEEYKQWVGDDNNIYKKGLIRYLNRWRSKLPLSV